MLTLETSIQLSWNVTVSTAGINDLANGLPQIGRELALELGAKVLEQAQDEHLERVFAGEAEIVCGRCGVVHAGPDANLGCRGHRPRKLRTSSGMLCFALRQVTCRECDRTWSPYPELLGIKPRQRVSEELERKLVEAVTNQSYGKTCTLANAWLGSSVSPRTLHRCVQARGEKVVFTPAAECKVAMADGTKVPAEKSRYGVDVRIAFQILGRYTENGRARIHKRIAGWSIGPGGWPEALPAGIASEAIVTDRESGIREVLASQHPGVRHQLCEWHMAHSAKHLLALDHVPVAQREALARELNAILWSPDAQAVKRARYEAFWQALPYRRAKAMLRDSQERILYDTPSAARTTSPAEREMREVNRRTDVGVLWSMKGVNNMLKLRHALRLNPDDFDRVWPPVQPVTFHRVPHA
jgi:Transposase, Mutator family